MGTGLPFPRRLAAMHDYMGKLRSVLVTGSVTDDRFKVGSLVPVSLTAEQFRAAILPDNNFRTSAGQHPDKSPGQGNPYRPRNTRVTADFNYGRFKLRKQGNKGGRLQGLSLHPYRYP